jgi:hypothetical protein
MKGEISWYEFVLAIKELKILIVKLVEFPQ